MDMEIISIKAISKYNYMENVTSISFRDRDKSITLRDLTDVYNGTTGYNKNTRSYKKAVAFIIENSLELRKMSFYKVLSLLDDKFNLGMRSYCAMD